MSLPQCIVDFLDHASTVQPPVTTCACGSPMQIQTFTFFRDEGPAWEVKVPICLDCQRAKQDVM